MFSVSKAEHTSSTGPTLKLLEMEANRLPVQ